MIDLSSLEILAARRHFSPVSIKATISAWNSNVQSERRDGTGSGFNAADQFSSAGHRLTGRTVSKHVMRMRMRTKMTQHSEVIMMLIMMP